MSLLGLRSIGQQIADGRYVYATYFRPSIVNAGATRWIDASYASGSPKFNAYAGAPLEANQLIGSGNNGMFTGPDQAGPKYIAQWTAYFSGTAPLPVYLYLCDYLMFYPLIDCDDDTPQVMVNNVTLPRYTDGVGVQMFLVSTVANTANATVTVNFTDERGIARVTSFILVSGVSGVVTSSSVANAPGFIPLGSANGVRSVEQVQLSAPAGGFAALCLAKPLVQLAVLEQEVPAEKSFGPEWCNLPQILPGAFLHMLMKTGSSNVGNLRSDLLITF